LQQLRVNNIIEMDFKHISFEGVDCIKLLLEVFQLSEFVLTVIHFSGYITTGIFFNA
jgi:hypothetical protein